MEKMEKIGLKLLQKTHCFTMRIKKELEERKILEILNS
jgi:hypothetical protein